MGKKFEKETRNYRLEIENYRGAKVADYVGSNFIIDTAKVGDHYETAIAHTLFNNGDWIVVSQSKTEKAARINHEEMIEQFLRETPDVIHDIYEDIDIAKRESIFGESEQKS